MLSKAGFEDALDGVPLSRAIALYAQARSFQYVADTFRLHRPAVRRAMSKASKEMIGSTDAAESALGAYIFGLIDKASAAGQGLSKRQLAKQAKLYCADTTLVGEFRVGITSPDIEQLFAPKASN